MLVRWHAALSEHECNCEQHKTYFFAQRTVVHAGLDIEVKGGYVTESGPTLLKGISIRHIDLHDDCSIHHTYNHTYNLNLNLTISISKSLGVALGSNIQPQSGHLLEPKCNAYY